MIIVKTERCYITIIIIIIISSSSSSSIIIENKIDWFPGLCHGNPQWLHHLHFVTCGLPFRHHGKYRCCVCCPLTPPFLNSWISRNMPSKHSTNPYSYFLGIGLTRVPAQKWLYSAESRLGNQKSRIENHFWHVTARGIVHVCGGSTKLSLLTRTYYSSQHVASKSVVAKPSRQAFHFWRESITGSGIDVKVSGAEKKLKWQSKTQIRESKV